MVETRSVPAVPETVEATAIKRIARIADIAKLAGVSTATVDRVLNDRRHVSPTTRQRVLQARTAIENARPKTGRERPWRIKVILPSDAGPSTEFLAACFEDIAADGRATVECAFTRKLEPAALARKLRACAGHRIDAIAVQALEHPRVSSAVAELSACEIPVLGLLSGLESAPLAGVVGIDNRAAGRTAGYLTGRMSHGPGDVAIVSGGRLYRAHEEREIGFRSILRIEFPRLRLVGTFSGGDDSEGNHAQTVALLSCYPDLAAIYNVGGGNRGIVRALQEGGVADEILLVGHNLTPRTRGYLLDGSMDAVIHQNMHTAARECVDCLIATLDGRSAPPGIVPVEIITRENTEGARIG